MKSKYLLAMALVIFLFAVPVTSALAQEEPPPPYAGMENPFPWSDAQAQVAGKKVYEQSCAGCHGLTGGALSVPDFSVPAYSKSLESKPDYAFWITSEGRLSGGMPPFKATLSEEQRWQALTYIWLLSTAPPPPVTVPPSTRPPEKAALALTLPRQVNADQNMDLVAVVKDLTGTPIRGGEVEFFLATDFFAKGLMKIGDATTNEQGVATIQYAPRIDGESNLVVRYAGSETVAIFSVTATGEVLYQTEVGIPVPALGPEIFIGPASSREIGEMGSAPTSALRFPAGILSWFLLPVAILILVWGTYGVTMRQVLLISTAKEPGMTGKTKTVRTVPVIWLGVIIALGIMTILMVITGPFSHFHLLH